MMVKTPSGIATSKKPIIRLETTDPAPSSKPIYYQPGFDFLHQ